MQMNLGDRIKQYESEYETIIPRESHLIVRIDGHHFSSFTKGFNKPFDVALSNAMVQTAKDLHDRFNAYSTYTQSDELSLFIPSLVNQSKGKGFWEHAFSGRTHKICSLVAAYTTMQFNKHLEEEYNRECNDESSRMLHRFKDKIGNAYFDARCFGVNNLEEVYNVFMFRGRDCIKNSRSMWSQASVSHKELQGKNGEEQIQYTLEKTGKDWNLIEDRYKYGALIKKESFQKPIDFRDLEYSDRTKYKTDEHPTCTRSRLVELNVPLNSFSTEMVDLISRQYL
jgi:tRNA(His) 5'-end guanylyltransferase